MITRMTPLSLRAIDIKKAACLSLGLVFLFFGSYIAANILKTNEDTSFGYQLSLNLQEILDTVTEDSASNYSGVIFRLENLDGQWIGTSGTSNLEKKTAIDPEAKFRCGSIIKPFIATVVLQLVEEEKLSLDDRLIDLLKPDISALFKYSDHITVRMLLNHTSGIGEWTNEGYEALYSPANKIWSEMEFFEMAAKKGSNFKPGTSYQYNNTEYNLLGLIIESKTGLTWRENIRQRIISKISLKNTTLPEPGNTKMPGENLHGYEELGGVLTDTTELDPSMAGAAGGHALVSNTEDLAIFIKALLGGTMFQKQETLSTMLTFVDTGDSGHSYGLGISRYLVPGDTYALGHAGGTAGYASFVLYLPEHGITASSVINTDQGEVMTKYLFPSLKILLNQGQ